MTHAPAQPQTPTAPIYVAKPPSNGLATASMVLGIIGCVFAVIPIVGAFGAVLGGLGLALAIPAFFTARKRDVGMGKTIAGLVLGVASIIMFFVVTAATVAAVDTVVEEIDKEVAAQTDTSEATDVSEVSELKDAVLGAPSKDMFAVTVDVTLTNNSDEVSDYMGTVVFESPNGKQQYGTGPLFVDSLKPGQTKVAEVMMLDELPKNASKVSVRLTDFDRMGSF